MPDIVMPRLSDSMDEGTILAWLKQVGEEVALGEELVEIETDKANMAYESDVAGTLTEILAEEGTTLPVGSPIARIGNGGEAPASMPAAGIEGDGARTAPAVASPGDDTRVKASPLARRIAREKSLDLSTLRGSGPAGRVVRKDVEDVMPSMAGKPAAVGPAATAPAATSQTAKGETTHEDLSKLQQVVARRMSESKATAPHFYLQAEIDMSRAVEAKKAIKAAASEGEVVPSFNDMVVKACAIALAEFPKANGAYRDGRFEFYSRVNVGVAVAAQGALVVPTVFDADRKGLRQIAADARALAAKVREGTITPPELSGGTFTVSNLGMFGIGNFSAVINTPQAGILAVGAIKETPVVRGGEIATAQLMNVTLACDHRILYGAEGAEFLARVRTLLEEPVSLAL
jgi:pyruvate dehydrogenase E2 component (dihydrolipoamide acetyltransferase)